MDLAAALLVRGSRFERLPADVVRFCLGRYVRLARACGCADCDECAARVVGAADRLGVCSYDRAREPCPTLGAQRLPLGVLDSWDAKALARLAERASNLGPGRRLEERFAPSDAPHIAAAMARFGGPPTPVLWIVEALPGAYGVRLAKGYVLRDRPRDQWPHVDLPCRRALRTVAAAMLAAFADQ